jgi:hypothetical protein
MFLAAVSHATANSADLLFGVLLGTEALAALVWAAVTWAGLGPLLVVGVCVLMLVVGYATGAPLYVRWKLSKPSFASWVARSHSQSDLEKPIRIGLFRIRQVDASSDGFLFYDSLDDMSDIGDGIAYLPHRARPCGAGAALVAFYDDLAERIANITPSASPNSSSPACRTGRRRMRSRRGVLSQFR